MTLTEEQREAIRVISKLPMAIGCQLCHPYIMENYGSHFIVLRDIIDSSNHIRESPKMISFDMEKARDAVNRCNVNKMVWAHSCAEHLPGAIDLIESQTAEIERLRAENLELQVAVFGPDGIRAHQACIIADQAARISELEIEIAELKADLEQSERVIEARLDVIDQQAARIKEHEDALVEELARGDYFDESQECEGYWWDRKNTSDCTQNDYRRNARLKLQAEGKIGPDAKPREGLYGKYCISKADGSPVDPNADYFVLRLDTDPVARRAAREYSYMTVDRKLALELQERITKYNPKMMDCINLQFFGVEKPQVWQITEERKAAIDRGLQFLEWSYAKNSALDTKEQIAVLWAMLDEVGQCE